MASPMEIESRSMDDKQTTTKRKVFNDIWLENEIFQDWLRRSSDENKALCSFCEIEMACKKSTSITHAKSKKHIKKSRIIDPTLPSASDDQSCVVDKNEAKENMKKAEITLAAFVATHNIPLSCVDDKVAVFSTVSVTKGVLGQMVLSRKKCCSIIRNVLGEKQSQDLSQNLSHNKFSVLVDESTTTADATDCSALKLYEAFESSFQERNVSLTNIVAVASDNASVMFGKHDSFVTRLRKVNPNLIVLNCILHTSALIASKTCAQLPKYFCDPCQNLLDTLDSEIVLKIKSNGLLFYKTATAGIIERLPYCNKFFFDLQILNPEIALSKEARKKFNNLNDLCLIFNLDDLVNNVNQQWLDLPNLFNDEHIQNLSMLTVENTWKEIFSYVVTKKRNRISTKTVAATCKVRSNFQAHGMTTKSFCADSTHLHLHDETKF
ncbi:hypothetical protein PV326_006337 [Microctonus aethiopoides]|nr:hypothetical protein PV326_006337 [Microctonus aethiopoides]